jgi:hypothetical protein
MTTKPILSKKGFNEDSMLILPYKQQRKIKVTGALLLLHGQALQDEYYLNLVDWSNKNVLAVGLGSCLYLWSASTSKVTNLYDLGPQDQVTRVPKEPIGRSPAPLTSIYGRYLQSRCVKDLLEADTGKTKDGRQ